MPESFIVVGMMDRLNFLSAVGDGIVMTIFWLYLTGVWGTGSPGFLCVEELL